MAPKTERFELRFDPGTLENIDNWRAHQPDLPSRAEAVRRLIETGLRKSIALTDGEQLITHLLCELHKHLKVEGEIDPNFVEAALHGGHHWGLEWEYPGIFHRHEDNPATVREVATILEMWRAIEQCHGKLRPRDVQRVENEADPLGKNVRFRGFDGNNESEHLGVAGFLIDDLRRFAEFKGRDLNSHITMLPAYNRMLKVFEPMQQTLHGGHLNATQLISLLNAMRNDVKSDRP